MTTSSYKGRDVFNTTAGSLYVSMGGRDQEMTFGIGKINYGALYGTGANEQTIAAATATADGPNKGAKFNLAHLPSDAVVIKDNGKAAATGILKAAGLAASKTYIVTSLDQDGDATAIATSEDKYQTGGHSAADILADTSAVFRYNGTTAITTGAIAAGDVLVTNAAVAAADIDSNLSFKEVNTSSTAFKAGHEYEIVSMGTSDGAATDAGQNDASAIHRAVAGISNNDTLVVGQKFTVDANASVASLAHLNALTQGMTFRMSTDTLTKDIEAIQGLINTARVQAGSQYAALESAVNYTTDLTAQYELGYNTVNDVNFSMETAHLAKNQILQQAATAMLAQANQGQQGLLQLIS
jgi:flagellin